MLLVLHALYATAFFSGVALAMPQDSSINEPAFSAPDGFLLSDTGSLPSPTTNANLEAGDPYPSSYGDDGDKGGGYGSDNKGTAMSSDGYTSQYPQATTKPKKQKMTTTTKSYSTPTYGSGGSKWGSSGENYDECISKCMAKYGPPPTTYKPPPSGTGAPTPSGSQGGGGSKTHHVIVAPKQGVFRFVPFIVQASPGDKIKFMWNANNHTVTKSSALLPCNKSSDKLFTSGQQNLGFTFNQAVNDTAQTFFYCGVPTHCQKGMFGVINSNDAAGSPSSYGNMEPQIIGNDPDLTAYASMTKKNCASNPAAAQWASSMDMSTLPDWSHPLVAENIMFTRNFLAANKDVLKEDGSIDLESSSSLMIPQDVSVALKNSSPSPSGSSPGTGSPSVASSNPTSGSQPQEAGALKSSSAPVLTPRALKGLVVALASIFFL